MASPSYYEKQRRNIDDAIIAIKNYLADLNVRATAFPEFNKFTKSAKEFRALKESFDSRYSLLKKFAEMKQKEKFIATKRNIRKIEPLLNEKVREIERGVFVKEGLKPEAKKAILNWLEKQKLDLLKKGKRGEAYRITKVENEIIAT